MKTVKAKIKGTNAILEGCVCDDSFFVSVDHDTFERYDLYEVELCESNPNSLTLEEAAEKWCKENGRGFVLRDKSAYYIGETLPAFKAGAEWQASQMPMPEDTVLFNKGVAEGRRLEREDMLKDVMEGEVVVPIYEGDDTWSAEIKIPGRYNIGDKVRIIVLKEEE